MAQVKVAPKDGVKIGVTLIIIGIVVIGWKASRIQREIASYKWSQEAAALYLPSSLARCVRVDQDLAERAQLQYFTEIFSTSMKLRGKSLKAIDTI